LNGGSSSANSTGTLGIILLAEAILSEEAQHYISQLQPAQREALKSKLAIVMQVLNSNAEATTEVASSSHAQHGAPAPAIKNNRKKM
jgi:hypothetical protein